MRVAIVTGADPGHVFPAAGLATRLIAAGHHATVLTVEKWLGPLRADAIPAAAITVTPRYPEKLNDFGYRLHGLAGESAPVIAAALDEPDLVVADVLSGGGALAAELVGLPWVELVPHTLHLPSKALPPPGSGLRPGRTPLGRGRDAVLRRLSDRSRRAGAEQRTAVRRGLGLPARSPEPASRLVATLPALEPDRPDWPAHTDIIGPLLWDPADHASVELRPPCSDAPLVLVVGSTASSGRPGLFEGALSIQGIRIAAPMLQEYAGTLPRNAVAGPGRLAPLLDQAALVISGAGHGMVARTLAKGIPLVLVPGGGDQHELANRVARLGAGIVVHRLSGLNTATKRILRVPSYTAAARRITTTQPAIDPVSACERAAERAG